ncbi:MAG: hypothetical protein JW795_03700, partial [Chitinivibrionales bacterium]|nr:hypothetical protein [Chitinivibrionales bacterium]
KQFDRMLDLLNVKYYINPYDANLSKKSIQVNADRLDRAQFFYSYTLLPSDSALKHYMLATDFDYRTTLLLTQKPAMKIEPPSLSEAPSIAIKTYTGNRIELSATTPSNGLLWLSEIWYPAWKVFVDGVEKRVLCADYSFRAVAIERGSHRVEFVYQSRLFAIGAILAAVALLVCTALIVFDIVKARAANVSPKGTVQPGRRSSHEDRG